jgi:hypothetical protein
MVRYIKQIGTLMGANGLIQSWKREINDRTVNGRNIKQTLLV